MECNSVPQCSLLDLAESHVPVSCDIMSSDGNPQNADSHAHFELVASDWQGSVQRRYYVTPTAIRLRPLGNGLHIII